MLSGMGNEKWSRGKTLPMRPTYMLRKEDALKDTTAASWQTAGIDQKAAHISLSGLRIPKPSSALAAKLQSPSSGEIPEPPNEVNE